MKLKIIDKKLFVFNFCRMLVYCSMAVRGYALLLPGSGTCCHIYWSNMLNVLYVCILKELGCFRPPRCVYRSLQPWAVHYYAATWGSWINGTTMGPSAICLVQLKLIYPWRECLLKVPEVSNVSICLLKLVPMINCRLVPLVLQLWARIDVLYSLW